MHNILSQYQASYPAILDIATYLSLNKLFGLSATRFWENFAVPLKHRPCAYCGTVKTPRTKGHVIPQALYPVSLSQARRITVPECTDCKALWEDAEPHFRNIMIAIWDPDQAVKDNRYRSIATQPLAMRWPASFTGLSGAPCFSGHSHRQTSNDLPGQRSVV